ncbi:MAG: hypothetical protein PHV11_09195 [Candidatus Bipolaricaulis sp.]|nr:hypothetical protein [Candidatus Bipolaricaulis sp.]
MSYGASIALFVRSLRQVGAARTGAAFGVAPFVGAALSLPITRELPAWPFFAALPIMGLSTILLTRERHSHTHRHAAVTHTHAHRHDDGHHDHVHQEVMGTAPSHVHEHAHDPVQHSHDHKPDQHHRHRHTRKTTAVK